MNIFILDLDIEKNAQYHCDKHVVKMIVEYCQLLSTTCHYHNLNIDGLYRKTHVNHPCAIWVRQSVYNFKYLLELTKQLIIEYKYRYNKNFKSERLIPLFEQAINLIPEGNKKMTDFAIVVGDIKNSDPIMAYRELYKTTKRDICTWKNREPPYWFN